MTEQRDTSPAAAQAQLAVFRRILPSQRVALALQMSDEARALAADGVRHRHPGASQAEIERSVRRLMLGDELADRVERSP